MQIIPDGQESEKSERSKKKRGQGQNLFSAVVLVAILILLSAGGGYAVGVQMGKKQGAKAAVSTVTDFINPVKAISNNAAFPYTVIGKVTKVNRSQMTVKLPDGSEKKVGLNDKTNVSQGSKILTINDIKTDSNITAFTPGKGEDLTALRVVLR